MGCAAIVTAVHPDPVTAERVIAEAEQLLHELEARWTRFDPSSELCRLNDRAGQGWVTVSEPTLGLIERMVHGWEHTDGAFDPTITAALEAAGYNRSFELLSPPTDDPAGIDVAGAESASAPGLSASVRVLPVPAPGCGGVVIDPGRRAVLLPSAVRLDAGGIGKGLAADLVVGALMRAGCIGAMASCGGDIRVCGLPPDGTQWRAEIADGAGRRLAARLLADGAVATSSVALRRWQVSERGETAHHVIDPARGVPASTDLVQVSVSTRRGWWAEVLATAALTKGRGPAVPLLAAHGVDAVLVVAAGGRHIVGRAFQLLDLPTDQFAPAGDIAS